MAIPFEPQVFGVSINIHLILEYLAFIIGFRYYVFLRKRSHDTISKTNRLSIIIGATLGALVGSRLIGLLENPFIISSYNIIELLNTKTIMGGLFGGLIGVEISKKIIGEGHSSGDLFTLSIIAGIFIGRVGCFLSGVNEFTYGSKTTFFMAMDLGDGINRHPVTLYELIFLTILFFSLKYYIKLKNSFDGSAFKIFMLLYFGFRFFIEFIKPNDFLLGGLSTIQWLCIICWIYYLPSIIKVTFNANKKIHLL